MRERTKASLGTGDSIISPSVRVQWIHHLGADMILKIWPKERIIVGVKTCRVLRGLLLLAPEVDFLVRTRRHIREDDVSTALKRFTGSKFYISISSDLDQAHSSMQGVVKAIDSGGTSNVLSLRLAVGNLTEWRDGVTLRNFFQQSACTLQHFTLCYRKTHISPRILRQVASGLSSCSHLTHLDLQDAIKTFTISSDSTPFGGPPETIQGTTPRTLDDMEEVRDVCASVTMILQKCTKLEFLDLEGLMLRNCSQRDNLSSALMGCTNMTYLNLGYSGYNRDDYELGHQFHGSLASLERLQVVGLKGLLGPERDMQALGNLSDTFRSLKGLRVLDLADHQLTIKCLTILVYGLVECKQLAACFFNRLPDLPTNGSSSDTPVDVGNLLAGMSSLTVLDLSHLRLDPLDAQILIKDLGQSKSLQFVNLASFSCARNGQSSDLRMQELLLQSNSEIQVYVDPSESINLRLKFFKPLSF